MQKKKTGNGKVITLEQLQEVESDIWPPHPVKPMVFYKLLKS